VAPQEGLIPVLETYGTVYSRALRDAVFHRLGLGPGALEQDLDLLAAFYEWLTQSEAPWDQVMHDWMCGEASAARAAQSPIAAVYREAAFAPIRAGLFSRSPLRPERLSHPALQSPAPVSLTIDRLEAIWAPIAADDDWSGFDAACAGIDALREALDLQPEKRWLTLS
jgi:uncharacterized protein YdiU (UPF0061 family)